MNAPAPQMENEMSEGNGELKIEKGIPIPGTSGAPRRGLREALRHLEVGDSVLVRSAPSTAGATAHQILGPGKYATRKEGGGVRVWRIA